MKKKIFNNKFENIKELTNKVEDYLTNGNIPRNNNFILKTTPSLYLRLGYENLEFSFLKFIIDKARNKHKMTNGEILNTIIAFSDPLFVFKSNPERSENKGKSSIAITSIIASDKELFGVTFYPSEEDKYNKEKPIRNIVTSIHQRKILSNSGINLLEKDIEFCKYVNDIKLEEIKKTNHIGSYPSQLWLASYSISLNNNILLKSHIVNCEADVGIEEFIKNKLCFNDFENIILKKFEDILTDIEQNFLIEINYFMEEYIVDDLCSVINLMHNSKFFAKDLNEMKLELIDAYKDKKNYLIDLDDLLVSKLYEGLVYEIALKQIKEYKDQVIKNPKSIDRRLETINRILAFPLQKKNKPITQKRSGNFIFLIKVY